MFTRPYMSDFLAILLIMIGAGMVIIMPATYFGGLIGASISFVALTALSCYAIIYGKSMGKSFANSNSPVVIDIDIFLTFLGIAILYAFIGFVAFSFRQVTHGVEGYIIPLTVCTVILVGYPLYLYISQVYSDYNTKFKYYSSNIVIAHPKEFPVQIDQIKFFDSKSKKSSSACYGFYERTKLINRFEGISEYNESMQSNRYYSEMTATLIPLNFDLFELSWYSVLENRFYKDTFPLDQSKLKVDQTYDGQMTISDMLISILPNGNVDLLKKEYSEVIHVVPYYAVAFTSVEGQTLDSIWKLFTPIGAPEESIDNFKRSFENLKNGTKEGLTADEILSLRIAPTYGFDITISSKKNEVNEFDEVRVVDFYLNQYYRSAEFLRKINRKPLPRLITIKVINDKDKRRCVDIVFDKKELLQQFTHFIEKQKEDVSFDINVNLRDIKKSHIALKAQEDKITLSGWSITEKK